MPKERLLEFNAKEGWEPLCKFLDVPIPEGPYPRTNDTKSVRRLLPLPCPTKFDSHWFKQLTNTIRLVTCMVSQPLQAPNEAHVLHRASLFGRLYWAPRPRRCTLAGLTLGVSSVNFKRIGSGSTPLSTQVLERKNVCTSHKRYQVFLNALSSHEHTQCNWVVHSTVSLLHRRMYQ